jgi:hypothetical protein
MSLLIKLKMKIDHVLDKEIPFMGTFPVIAETKVI